jgi:hypothetical protein
LTFARDRPYFRPRHRFLRPSEISDIKTSFIMQRLDRLDMLMDVVQHYVVDILSFSRFLGMIVPLCAIINNNSNKSCQLSSRQKISKFESRGNLTRKTPNGNFSLKI